MRTALTVILYIFLSISAIGANNGIRFKHFSVEDGLSQSTVRAIIQDNLGNMWFGTQNGLNSYDGHIFKSWHNSPSDSTTIADNSIFSLYLDDEKNIWIGTASGLSLMDRKTGTFMNYTIEGAKYSIYDIEEFDNNLLIATEFGLYAFDKENRRFKSIEQLSGMHIRDIYKSDRFYTVGTKNGLYIFDNWKVRPIKEFANEDISAVIKSSGKEGYWVGTHGHGLFRTDSNFKIIKHLSTKSDEYLLSDYIRILKGENFGKLWIGTYDGLIVYNEQDGSFSEYRHSEEASSLSHNSVWSIYIDRQHGAWIGTYFGGINYYNRISEKFTNIPLDKGKAYGFVSFMTPSSDNNSLWIGTNDDGVLRYNTYSGKIDRFDSSNITTVAGKRISDNVKCIIEDGKGGLYVGTHLGGLYHLNINSNVAEVYDINEKYPINNGCYSILEYDENTLLAGSNSGLYLFDKISRTFRIHPLASVEPKLYTSLVTCLFRDSYGTIWIGTGSGLFSMDNSGNHIRGYRTTDNVNDIYIYTITESKYGFLWIGTNKGLYRYNRETGKLSAIDIPEMRFADNVYSILEDYSNILWLSTDNGICSLDPIRNTCRIYDGQSNRHHYEYTPQAGCKTADGTFFFGGLKGITSFRPLDISDNPFTSLPYISDISIFYDQLKPLGTCDISRNDDGTVHKARLSSSDNIITLHFSVSDPVSDGNNTFSYMLQGFDRQWFETTSREVTYSNLKPGKYVFKLKAANSDGRWSNDMAELPLRILPRWWQTMAFKILVLGIIALMVYYFLKSFNNRLRMKMELDMEKREKERIKAVSQEKVEFFINLSHELQTPLTLILSPLKEIESHGNTDEFIDDRLKFIRRSSMKLMHTINQMLSYRKADQGLSKLQVRMCSPDEIAEGCFSLFEEEAASKDIEYILNSELEGRQYPVDGNILDIILMNLLSNAFKFTDGGGIIRLSLKKEEKQFKIVIRDTGIGIPKENMKNVFDLFYKADVSRDGTGIGLAIVKKLVELHHGKIFIDSEVGEFTEVTVSLPADIGEYSFDEIAQSKPTASELESEDVSYYLADAIFPVGLNDTSINSEDKETLLVAISDADLRKYISDSFSSEFRIITASDGKTASDLIRDDEPDIVLVDRGLPIIDGRKICQSIKRNIQTCHIPVIILGTRDTNEEEKNNIDAGADAYLSQPFSISLLQAKVANILKIRDRLRHHYSSHTEIEPEKVTSNSIDGEFLKKAVKVVEDNIDNEQFSSNDFADAMCMSRSNLYLKITSITGESATQFIRKIRFNKACRMLLERKYTIAEISAKVGFSSPSYFATSFKKYVGCSPNEYIKTQKKEDSI